MPVWLFLIFILCNPSKVDAGPALAADAIPSGSYINEFARYFIDHEGLDQDEIVQKRDVMFPAEVGVPHVLAATNTTVWMLLEIEAKEPTSRVFSFLSAGVDRLDVFHFNDKLQALAHLRSGDRLPFQDRQIQYRHPAFSVSMEPGRNILLFRVRNFGTSILEAQVWENKDFQRHMSVDLILLGACLGAILVIGIYNFFLFLSVKDRIFLYYSMYIAAMFVSQATIQGISLYFEPDSWEYSWLMNKGLFVSVNLSTIGALIFAGRFLNVDSHMTKAKPFILFFVVVGLVNSVCLVFLEDAWLVKLTNINTAAGSCLCLILGVIASWRRYKPGYFFVIAWTLLLVSTIGLTLSLIGVIDFRNVYAELNLLAVVVEGTILSFALGYRINLMHAKKEEERKKKDHYFRQMEKVFHPHQLNMMRDGKPLEETMPTGSARACVIAFDIANSSAIGHARNHEFFENVMKKCQMLMSENYNPDLGVSNAFRIKEMGDGFLCSVGFPFALPVPSSLESFAYKLAMAFIGIFEKEVEAYFHGNIHYCGVGISLGEVVGYFPSSGTKEYDLFGDGIIHAVRYESMRKVIMKNQAPGNVVILQKAVFDHLSEAEQAQFMTFDLKKSGLVVRDDPDADTLYYCVTHFPMPVPTAAAVGGN